MQGRITREETLSFLLTHIVVERQHVFELNQESLFRLLSLAAEAEGRINSEEGSIPHEIVESVAAEFFD